MGAVLAGVCLALAEAASEGAATGPALFVPTRVFTLAWTHSIEKIRWEEDYRVSGSADPDSMRLHAVAARVHGSGAGMEPPEGAVHRDGWYHYRPATAPLAQLLLTRSGYTADYEWCQHGQCRPMSEMLPSDGGVTRLWPCRNSDITEPLKPAG